MKKGQTAAAILLLAFALNGCGGGVGKTAFAPTETSLYVTKEGTVTSADVDICMINGAPWIVSKRQKTGVQSLCAGDAGCIRERKPVRKQ